MPARVRGGPRRLLMTTDAVGGVWSYALDLARSLSSSRIDTMLAVLGPELSAEQRREAQSIDLAAVVETRLPLDWMCEGRDALRRAAQGIAFLAQRIDADLVQLNGSALAAEAVFGMPVLAVHHSCLATWWAVVKREPLPPGWGWHADLVRRHLAAADRVVTPSRAFAELTTSTYRLARTPVVVHNGRSPACIEPKRAGSLRAVFTAGRLWDEGKNIAALDRAAASLDAPVFAAGPLTGPDGSRIAVRNLRLLGRLPEAGVRSWLASRPIFVSTARYEPFGLAVLEAAQAGCALILSDIPSFRELWQGAARFVDADDDAALAAAALKLLRNPATRRQMGEVARERAESYRLDRAASAMTALYGDLICGAGGARPAEDAA